MYSDKFKHIKPEILTQCRELGPIIWSRMLNKSEKISIINLYFQTISNSYNIPAPRFEYDSDNIQMYRVTGGGNYSPVTKTITLYKKLSYVTLLHEFRHHMQHVKPNLKKLGDNEEDARAWSMSIFKLTFPEKWQRAVDRDIVHFV